MQGQFLAESVCTLAHLYVHLVNTLQGQILTDLVEPLSLQVVFELLLDGRVQFVQLLHRHLERLPRLLLHVLSVRPARVYNQSDLNRLH